MIKITLDKSVDAAYIYLDNELRGRPAWVKKTLTVNPQEVDGMINLDFDGNGILNGIEVIDASKKLPKSLLDSAEIIG